jgi:hypothetical protein
MVIGEFEPYIINYTICMLCIMLGLLHVVYCHVWKVVEDTHHFGLVCPVLRDIRIKCLKPFYNSWCTKAKVGSLMSDMSNNTITF